MILPNNCVKPCKGYCAAKMKAITQSRPNETVTYGSILGLLSYRLNKSLEVDRVHLQLALITGNFRAGR